MSQSIEKYNEIFEPYVKTGRIEFTFLGEDEWNMAVRLQTVLPISPELAS